MMNYLRLLIIANESFSDPVEWKAGVLAVLELELRKRVRAQ